MPAPVEGTSMMDGEKGKARVHSQPCLGLAWIGGWLFSIGFLHLTFWKGVLAILLWPYYLGVHFSALAR
jgi:hypothetical protein